MGDQPRLSVAWALLPLILYACGDNRDANQVPVTQTDQTESGDPQKNQTDRPYEIIEIPTTVIALNRVPEPLPAHAQGLSFQMSKGPLPVGAQRHAPIGDLAVTPENDVVMSFPNHQQVIRLNYPGYKTQIYGPKTAGGNGVDFQAPSRVSVWDDLVYVSSAIDGTVTLLNRDGSLNRFLYAKDLRNPIIGAGPEFFSLDPGHPKPIQRYDQNGALIRRYIFFEPPEDLPAAGFRSGSICVEADKQLHFVNHQGNRVATYADDGMMTHLFEIGPGLLGQVTATDIAKRNAHLWILLVDVDQHISYILALQPFQQEYAIYRCRMFADGFAMNEQFVVLFDRQRGAAQTWRWGDVATPVSP